MQIGDTYEYKNVVTKEITAGALGSGGLDIFATPFLICWMEAAAYYYMKEQLPEGKSSVGTMVNVRHVSPSPIGAEITAKAELIAISENARCIPSRSRHTITRASSARARTSAPSSTASAS